jgi:hypothetical protein
MNALALHGVIHVIATYIIAYFITLLANERHLRDSVTFHTKYYTMRVSG